MWGIVGVGEVLLQWSLLFDRDAFKNMWCSVPCHRRGQQYWYCSSAWPGGDTELVAFSFLQVFFRTFPKV